ncbi:hypothetical protein HRI_003215600 [Hibiscus trionum]|uniref:GAG-pre-integrase domain-containing protein n=1 Tax=Hibiscus trionum TaxID=183268 RepID=A0A9W7MBK7_HIBTR|nr:hypothetical protein HRI_003215600 [Hibiscus trionum]
MLHSSGFSPAPAQVFSHSFSSPSPGFVPSMPSSTFASPHYSYGSYGSSQMQHPTAFIASPGSHGVSNTSSVVPSAPFGSPAVFGAGSSFSGNSSGQSGSREVVWCADSGATHHITNDRVNLQTTTPYTGTSSVLMGNGSSIPITYVGSGLVSSAATPLYLHHLLCAPDVKRNLLSVSQFARDNAVYFEFHSHGCFVKDAQTSAVLLEGRLTPEGLYELSSVLSAGDRIKAPLSSAVSPTVFNVSSKLLSLDVWHKRLGHPSLATLQSALWSNNIVVNNDALPAVCSSCLQGKAHKLPFSLSSTVYTSPFQLVVSDV